MSLRATSLNGVIAPFPGAAWLSALIWVLFAGAAPGQQLGFAQDAFERGDFLAAADASAAADTLEGRTLAGRALLAHCLFGARGREAERAVDRAIAMAEAALARAPEAAEPRFQLALALGVKARRVSVVEAFAGRYAPRGRRLIEEGIARAPDFALGHALLGAWHLEVLRRGGGAGGRMFHARFEDGVAAFARARALAPDDPALALLYGVALLELDPEAHGGRALDLLAAAAALPGRDALERRARAEAGKLAEVIARDGPKAAAALAAQRFE